MRTAIALALFSLAASSAALADGQIGIPYRRYETVALRQIIKNPRLGVPLAAQLIIDGNRAYLDVGIRAGTGNAADMVELPIIRQYVDTCGTRIIVAEKDLRPVDGPARRILVRDHSHRVCDDYRQYVTEVEFTTVGSGFNPQHEVTRSTIYFGGGRLEVQEVF